MLNLKSTTNNKNNKVFNEDSNELVKNIKADAYGLYRSAI